MSENKVVVIPIGDTEEKREKGKSFRLTGHIFIFDEGEIHLKDDGTVDTKALGIPAIALTGDLLIIRGAEISVISTSIKNRNGSDIIKECKG